MGKGWLAVLATVCRAGAEVYIGFDTNQPVVPTADPDLVVEQVWQLDGADGLIQMKWVPNSDQIITVHRQGTLRLYDSIDADPMTGYSLLYDMQEDVYSGGTDHGLMSMELSPDFTAAGGSIFVLYTGEPKDVELLPNLAGITPIRPPDFGPTGVYNWDDTCPNLAQEGMGENLDGQICEHPYYIDRVTVDLVAMTAVKDITLMQTECGASSTHGPGTILLAGNDLLWSQGDGSQYASQDYGNLDDGCYDPAAPQPGFQGSFRAQRDDSPNGKVHRIPYASLESATELDVMDMEVVTKGLRNPFRIFYHNTTDALYVGDVGYGDATTSERIFRHDAVSTTAVSSNFGWPCVEGVRSSPNGPYALFDSAFEAERVAYVAGAGLTGCDGAYAAAEDFMLTVDPAYVRIASTAATVPDATWVPPLFEYRVDLIDVNYPTVCTSALGSITNVHIYDGVLAPASITGKLIFADLTKGCVWYFENNADGTPNTDVNPTVLLSGVAVVDMRTGADGYLYAIDYYGQRVIRMYQNGLGPYKGDTPAPTYAPGGVTAAPTLPFVEPLVNDGVMCFPPYGIPEIPWTITAVNDGITTYYGELVLSGANFVFADGTTMRTRAWDSLLPGPIMRMKPCSIYNLRVTNDEAGWTNLDGDINTMHSPANTNLHLHGPHISGQAPGDDTFTTILPGDFYDYSYNIPCDHVGGTHLYHTHYHGSVALQTDSGAIGMLIMEPSVREAYDMPFEYQAMPELMILMQEISPTLSTGWAAAAKDALFETTIVDDFTLVNGCAAGAIFEVEAGQWTRLRLLRSALTYNAMLELIPAIATDAACDVALLAKDGVPLQELPRMLPAGNLMFMSLSSRIDVAVRCPLAGSSHVLQGRHVSDPTLNDEYREILANINVLPSLRVAAEDLPAYTPCRPNYLTDLTTQKPTIFDAFEIRGGFSDDAGSYIFAGEDTPAFRNLTIGNVVSWDVTGQEIHPLHIHINHMQMGDMTANQWDDVPGWNQEGDWIDTLSVPGTAGVYLRPSDYNGTMVMHCHIAEHSDTGVIALNSIIGAGYGADFPVPVDYGNCSATVPASTSYNALPAAIPGTIQAAEFDMGGEAIAYHNINIATNAGNVIRVDEAVEIRGDGVTNTVSYTRAGEWLRYSVTVTAAGTYGFTLVASQDAADTGIPLWSLWEGVDDCQPPTSTVGLLAQSTAVAPATRTITGTGYDNYVPTAGNATFTAAGPTTLLLCFDDTATGFFAPQSLVFA